MKRTTPPKNTPRKKAAPVRGRSAAAAKSPPSDCASVLSAVSFRDGSPIPLVPLKNEWWMTGKEKRPACCYYGNKKSMDLLYNFYVLADPRGVAPDGCRLASASDFLEFIRSICGDAAIDQAAN